MAAKRRKLLGFVEIAAFGGVNSGGHAHVEGPLVAVNQPVMAPNLEHQSRVFGKRYEVTEVEDETAMMQKGGQMSAYRKDINAEQKDMSDAGNDEAKPATHKGKQDVVGDIPRIDDEVKKPSGVMDKTDVLKNLVDNVAAQGRSTQLLVITTLIMAAVAIVIGLVALFA
jgi:hypothetical protein